MKTILVFLIVIFIFTVTSTDAQIINMRNVKQVWKTDTLNRKVELNEFRALLKRDAIPSIDEPKFWKGREATKTYFKNEPVTVVEHNGIAKAYPHALLLYHEIVNDTIEDMAFSVTYCPLCNSALVFNRNLIFQGEAYLLSFGTSGMLRKSNLVMWDRQTESWWQQLSGEGLVGKFAGVELEFLPSMILSLEEFNKTYPKGLVLSTNTGEKVNKNRYGKNPYVKYDDLNNDAPRLFFEDVDPRLPAMERVVHVPADKIDRVYPYSIIQKEHVINDQIGKDEVVLFHEPGTVSILDEKNIEEGRDIGSVTVFNRTIDGRIIDFIYEDKKFRDVQTNSVWDISGKCVKGSLKDKQLRPRYYGVHFAFAWFSMYPESELYKP